MAQTGRALPESMISPKTGEALMRGHRPFEVSYKSERITVELPGYYPEGEGEGVFVGDDMAAADDALRLLRRRVDGIPTPQQIRDFRSKLRLSQRDAGALLRVGENAFDKYERGLVEPSGPTARLMALLERHPELVAELRAMP